MFRRDVVSCGSAVGGLAELGERLGVVAVGEVEQARRAVGDGAVRARVERLLREERGRFLLALRQVRERELGQRRRVGGLAHEHLARLGDGLVDLPALAERRDEQRARVDGVRMVLHEVRRARRPPPCARRGAGAPRPARRRRPASRAPASRRARAAPRTRRGRPALREDGAEVVARLPEVRVERDRLAQERRRPIALPVLRGLHALHHLADRLRIRRRKRQRRGPLRALALPPPHAARERERRGRARRKRRGAEERGETMRSLDVRPLETLSLLLLLSCLSLLISSPAAAATWRRRRGSGRR